MALTPAQLTTLKNDIIANNNQIGGIAIKDMPHSADNAAAISDWYNLLASPDYWVWDTAVTRARIYNQVGSTGTTWDWTFYKNQSVPEQNAWTQMFMGDQANFSLLNLRVGISKIFTSGSSVNRDHAFAVGRRQAKRVEKVFAIAVSNPPVSSGNTAADPRGATTNPDVMGFDGSLSYQDVQAAWNS